MDFSNRIDYEHLSDRQLYDLIVTHPHNEEAAAYLLYVRYQPLLLSIYIRLAKERFYCDDIWYDDCVSDLLFHFRGKAKDWHTLATFDWRSSFGTWLRKVSWNKFSESLYKLIDKAGKRVSIDGEGSNDPKPQILDGGEDDYERRQRKVLLMEAISQLEDKDQKFVIMKRLQGYNSKEIAILLQKRWQKHGIKKYNKKGELVIPTAAYVDVRHQRAKDNLREIIGEI